MKRPRGDTPGPSLPCSGYLLHQQIQAPRVAQAEALVKQSDAACQKGDRALSARKANEALKLLKP